MIRTAFSTSSSPLRQTSRCRGNLLKCTASNQRWVHFDWQDPLNTTSLLKDDEIAIQETAREYCQDRLLPRVLGELNWQTPGSVH